MGGVQPGDAAVRLTRPHPRSCERRTDLGSLPAALGTAEPVLNIRQPDLVAPAVSVGLEMVRTTMVRQ